MSLFFLTRVYLILSNSLLSRMCSFAFNISIDCISWFTLAVLISFITESRVSAGVSYTFAGSKKSSISLSKEETLFSSLTRALISCFSVLLYESFAI